MHWKCSYYDHYRADRRGACVRREIRVGNQAHGIFDRDHLPKAATHSVLVEDAQRRLCERPGMYLAFKIPLQSS